MVMIGSLKNLSSASSLISFRSLSLHILKKILRQGIKADEYVNLYLDIVSF
jgi:hypothetical protein